MQTNETRNEIKSTPYEGEPPREIFVYDQEKEDEHSSPSVMSCEAKTPARSNLSTKTTMSDPEHPKSPRPTDRAPKMFTFEGVSPVSSTVEESRDAEERNVAADDDTSQENNREDAVETPEPTNSDVEEASEDKDLQDTELEKLGLGEENDVTLEKGTMDTPAEPANSDVEGDSAKQDSQDMEVSDSLTGEEFDVMPEKVEQSKEASKEDAVVAGVLTNETEEVEKTRDTKVEDAADTPKPTAEVGKDSMEKKEVSVGVKFDGKDISQLAAQWYGLLGMNDKEYTKDVTEVKSDEELEFIRDIEEKKEEIEEEMVEEKDEEMEERMVEEVDEEKVEERDEDVPFDEEPVAPQEWAYKVDELNLDTIPEENSQQSSLPIESDNEREVAIAEAASAAAALLDDDLSIAPSDELENRSVCTMEEAQDDKKAPQDDKKTPKSLKPTDGLCDGLQLFGLCI